MSSVIRWFRGKAAIIPALCLSAATVGGAEVEKLRDLAFGSLEPREIRVHLPPGGVGRSTPVLIAFDGHMMDAWRLDATIAGLVSEGRIEAPLVVAIPAGKDRIDEYGMAGALDYAGRGRKAAEFQKFVLETVLPAVRRHYSVAAEPENTGVMGASLGGLAAFDIAWGHPDVFGFAGIFSGSFWWRGADGSVAQRQSSRLAHQLVKSTAQRRSLRLWFEVGTHDETDDRDGNGVIDSIQDTTELIDGLEKHGLRWGADIVYVEVSGGRHNEKTWSAALPGFLEWALPRTAVKTGPDHQ